ELLRGGGGGSCDVDAVEEVDVLASLDTVPGGFGRLAERGGIGGGVPGVWPALRSGERGGGVNGAPVEVDVEADVEAVPGNSGADERAVMRGEPSPRGASVEGVRSDNA
ncbi:hypothetical protein, partial [Burkholderia sp. 3C]